MMNDLVFISENIYHLKREYGSPLRLGKITPLSYNVTTGVKTNDTQEVRIKRAIRLPESISYSFLKALGSAKGAEVLTGTVQIIIDVKDVPQDVDPKAGFSYAIQNNERLDVVKVDTFEHAWVVTAKRITGAVPPSQQLRSGIGFGSSNANQP